MFQIKTKAPEQTFAWGRMVAGKLKPGTVLLLEGDLGAGKTLFVQGMAAALHVAGPVTSPTFNLMNLYEGDHRLYHFDLYRLEREEDLEEIGFYEYSEAPDGIIVVEWPDKFPECLPAEYIYMKIERTAEPDERVITLRLQGEKNRATYEELKTACPF